MILPVRRRIHIPLFLSLLALIAAGCSEPRDDAEDASSLQPEVNAETELAPPVEVQAVVFQCVDGDLVVTPRDSLEVKPAPNKRSTVVFLSLNAPGFLNVYAGTPGNHPWEVPVNGRLGDFLQDPDSLLHGTIRTNVPQESRYRIEFAPDTTKCRWPSREDTEHVPDVPEMIVR